MRRGKEDKCINLRIYYEINEQYSTYTNCLMNDSVIERNVASAEERSFLNN